MKRRVVITGMGAVTPLGNSVAETWEGICQGRSGIGPLTRFDCSEFETRIAGELKGFTIAGDGGSFVAETSGIGW